MIDSIMSPTPITVSTVKFLKTSLHALVYRIDNCFVYRENNAYPSPSVTDHEEPFTYAAVSRFLTLILCLLRSRRFSWFLMSNFFWNAGYFAILALLPMRMAQLGIENEGISLVFTLGAGTVALGRFTTAIFTVIPVSLTKVIKD